MHLASLPKMKWTRFREPPLPITQQILFFKRCSHILNKGYPLLDALQMTGWDTKLKFTCDVLTQHLSAGHPIHEAFIKARFSLSVTNFLYFSQVHHNLSRSFQQCRDMLQLKKDYKEKFLKIIRYPVFLFVFLIIAFTILQRTVIPSFLHLFEGEKGGTFRLMIIIMHAMNGIAILVLLTGLLLIGIVIILPRMTLKKKLSLYERVSLLKLYHSYSVSLLFTTHLHSLLQAGLPLKNAIEMIQSHKKYELLSHYCKELLHELSNGKTFAQAVYSCPLFRPELTNIFHHTNDIEALKDELELLTEFFMEYLNQKITTWLHVIQPAFFIIIATVIILIYASIMLPLYQWMNQI
ncbi:type II secretion system F family protein [Halobacillus faecis]|uniref:type II secretion system F family protein n=1 Tax=Halobacillus faecis TaxID=360184 RepID=UPI001FE4EDD8|nr:type II secretion system F family protein [Halobacillus faecis]